MPKPVRNHRNHGYNRHRSKPQKRLDNTIGRRADQAEIDACLVDLEPEASGPSALRMSLAEFLFLPEGWDVELYPATVELHGPDGQYGGFHRAAPGRSYLEYRFSILPNQYRRYLH